MWTHSMFFLAAFCVIAVTTAGGSPVEVTTDQSWSSSPSEDETVEAVTAMTVNYRPDIVADIVSDIKETFDSADDFIHKSYRSNDVEFMSKLSRHHKLIMVWIYSLREDDGMLTDLVALLLNSAVAAESDENFLNDFSFSESDVDNILKYLDSGKSNVKLPERVLDTLCSIVEATTITKFNQTAVEYGLEKGYVGAIRLMANRGSHMKRVKDNGDSLMHLAALVGNVNALRVLKEQGVDVDKKNAQGLTPLYYAASKKHNDAVMFLKSAGADIENRDDNGDTLLHLAAKNGDLNAAESLLNNGASLDAENEGMTPLYRAAQYGQDAMITFLREKGADLEHTWNECGLLNWAVRYNHTTAVKKFIELGVDVNTPTTGSFFTPLHWAARGGFVPLAEYLIEHGAGLNSLTSPGRTPMHEAAFWCQYDMVQLLFKKGAKVDIKDKYGHKPINMAKMNDHFAMAAMIQAMEDDRTQSFLNFDY